MCWWLSAWQSFALFLDGRGEIYMEANEREEWAGPAELLICDWWNILEDSTKTCNVANLWTQVPQSNAFSPSLISNSGFRRLGLDLTSTLVHSPGSRVTNLFLFLLILGLSRGAYQYSSINRPPLISDMCFKRTQPGVHGCLQPTVVPLSFDSWFK